MNKKRRALELAMATGAAAVIVLFGGAGAGDGLDRLVKTYSTQKIVCLDVGETFTVTLHSGVKRTVRLVSVEESRDNVIELVRRADVRVDVNGKAVDLASGPYVMPTEVDGLRLLADTTSAWTKIPKRVQFSVWDAADPVVNTRRFGFPLRDFRMFSQGTQTYNEPVHLGAGDGDPEGQVFYHDYGFDNAGFEGREDVVSAVEGKILRFWPGPDDISSVLVEDVGGFVWEYGHLCAVAPGIVSGGSVVKGQKIGVLGKTGPSGNFSHIHLGSFLSVGDLDENRANRRLNLYPWLVTAYQASYLSGLCAVARPHHEVLTGENTVFDGSNSLAWGGRKIVEWRWVFPGGRSVKGARAEAAFDKPGSYSVALWVKDDRGAEDVDFCGVKVFTRGNPEGAMPHIFMTYAPTQNVQPGTAVAFRFWYQGKGEGGPIRVDFGDGTVIEGYRSYDELRHAFTIPGVHVVTVHAEEAGYPMTSQVKVVAGPAR